MRVWRNIAHQEAGCVVKVIAISGARQSGATFLSVLLSQAPSSVNLGPFRHLWQAAAQACKCSCGEPLGGCTVHGPALAATFEQLGGTRPEVMDARISAFLKAAEALDDWGDPAARAAMRSAHEGMLQPLSAALHAVREQTGAHTVIETSGAPAMALAYDLMDDADLRVLNLVRDPRAVVMNGPSGPSGLPVKLRLLRQWTRRQRRLDRWRHGLGARYLAVHYEDFALRPRDTLATTLQWAGLQATPGLFLRPDMVQLSWERQHLYPPANQMLLAAREERVRIDPPDPWRARSHPALRALAVAFTWREMRRHYPRDEA